MVTLSGFSGFFRPSANAGLDRVLNRLTNPSPQNDAMPILPLEGAVIAGRSLFGWLRDGFLELQERLFEEITVAAMWLWGVVGMEKLFDLGAARVLGKSVPVGSWKDIAWRRAGVKSVDLLAQERYAGNAQTLRRLLAFKSVRLAFSVSAALGVIAVLIPKLNQWKTAWIVNRFYRPKPPGVSAPPVPTAMPVAPPAPRALAPASYTLPYAPGPYYYAAPPQSVLFPHGAGYAAPTPWAQPAMTMPANTPRVRFGFSGGLGQATFNTLQHMGDWITQTNLGKLAVMDVGLTTGRAVSAAPRSTLESLEIVVRDALSACLYFWSVPLMMLGFHKAARRLLQVSLELEPQVAQRLNQRILTELSERFGTQPLTTSALGEVFHGTQAPASQTALARAQAPLRQAMSQARRETFEALLADQLAVAFPQAEATGHFQQIARWLGEGDAVRAEGIDTLLRQIEKEKALSWHTRTDLAIAVKQAFRHSAGQRPAEILALLDDTLRGLEATEARALKRRLSTLAAQDGRDVANSAFRWAINTARLGNVAEKLLAEAEAYSPVLERAASLAQPLDAEAKARAISLMEALGADATGPAKTLLARQGAVLRDALSDNGARLLTTALDEAADREAAELLRGGLTHDSLLAREALHVTHALAPDARGLADAGKFARMQRHIHGYLDDLLKAVAAALKDNPRLTTTELPGVLETFYRKSRRARYGAYGLSALFGMALIGVIVPKLQYAVTRRITGQDSHPGIAALLAHHPREAATGHPHGTSALFSGPRLRRETLETFGVPGP